MKRVLHDVPRWHVYLHRDARGLGTSADARDDPLLKFEDEIFDRLHSGELERLPEDVRDPNLAAWAVGSFAIALFVFKWK